MKTTIITTILVGMLALTAVRAETVYLTNVGLHNMTDVSPGYYYTGTHSESLELWDANHITSICLQPFFTATDAQGNLVTDPIGFVITKFDGTFWPVQIGVRDMNQPVTIPTQTFRWESSDEDSETAIRVLLTVGFSWEEGGAINLQYLQNLTSPQHWFYGFDVLSYETAQVPEPSTLMLLAGGVLAVVLYRRKVKSRSA